MVSKSFWLFLASLCILSAAEESAVDMFKDDVTKVAEKVKEFGEHISKMLGLEDIPDANKIMDIIKTQARSFVEQAEQVSKQLEVELKNASNSTLVQGFSDFNQKVSETVRTLRTEFENSGAAEKAAELQGKLQDGITQLVQEGEKLAQTLQPRVAEAGSEFEKLTKKVLNDAAASLGEIQDKIHAATGHADHGQSQPQTP